VVWKLDCLSHLLRDVLTIMERLAEAKAGFRGLTEAFDTTTPAGDENVEWHELMGTVSWSLHS
jgi:DNA invertase Pin-like site-specific DNA recombinase